MKKDEKKVKKEMPPFSPGDVVDMNSISANTKHEDPSPLIEELGLAEKLKEIRNERKK